jgi:hypothetical protein
MIHTFYASGTLAPTTPTPYVTDYQISRSLRFNSADSAYLNRTPASAGNRRTWTWSGWVKRANLATGYIQGLFEANDPSSTTVVAGIRFETDNTLKVLDYNGSFTTEVKTTQVFRDVSAWYHIVVAYDTTQATSSDRVKLYVNGTQVTSFSTTTYPAQNSQGYINNNGPHYLGACIFTSVIEFLDGYMTEVNFIDGQALTPSSFGYTNPATGVWSPLAFVGTYGTNGFELNFSDNSNTTAATLGKDYSGNGNNWTPNNFSVTAGVENDSLVDVPTPYGVDTGVGGEVRGNYCTWNPVDPAYTNTRTVSNGNLFMSYPASGNVGRVNGTLSVSSGKWYFEYRSVNNGPMVGIVKSDGSTAYVYDCDTGTKFTFSPQNTYITDTAYGATWGASDTIGVALDMDAGTVTFYKNGTSQGTAFSGLTGAWTATMGYQGGSGTFSGNLNCGQRPFAYTAPSGFKALCTQNLPTPTIGATSTTLATQYFAPVTYTGTGTTQTITVGFQPDFVWNKCRSTGYSHYLEDSVRGATKVLRSASTDAETTNTDAVTVFNANGFIAGGNASTNYPNDTYVAWNWRASNATAVTNTAGSITSTVSANTTAGFSIVTYTGTGSNATVGHGLGVAPTIIFIKNRSTGSTNWVVYNLNATTNVPSARPMYLNTGNGEIANADIFNYPSTNTTTVFNIGTNAYVNTSTNTYVAYCWTPIAGYSAMNIFTGNGSTDGPFVYCGFRPAYLLIKCTSNNGDWFIWDTARDTYNVSQYTLLADTNAAETSGSANYIDILSNGFKVKATTAGFNGSTDKFLFMAFASNPFKYSLAR